MYCCWEVMKMVYNEYKIGILSYVDELLWNWLIVYDCWEWCECGICWVEEWDIDFMLKIKEWFELWDCGLEICGNGLKWWIMWIVCVWW